VTARAVTSLTNPTVKAVRALHLRKERDETGRFVAEGLKAVTEGLETGHAPRILLHGAEAGASLTGIKASVEKGLKARPLEETVRDTLAWHETRPADKKAPLRSGFSPEQEAQILADWRAKNS